MGAGTDALAGGPELPARFCCADEGTSSADLLRAAMGALASLRTSSRAIRCCTPSRGASEGPSCFDGGGTDRSRVVMLSNCASFLDFGCGSLTWGAGGSEEIGRAHAWTL